MHTHIAYNLLARRKRHEGNFVFTCHTQTHRVYAYTTSHICIKYIHTHIAYHLLAFERDMAAISFLHVIYIYIYIYIYTHTYTHRVYAYIQTLLTISLRFKRAQSGAWRVRVLTYLVTTSGAFRVC